jgi:hypothetical protein
MRAVFEWLDAHPDFYWIPAVTATLLLMGWILLGLRAADREKSFRQSDWLSAGLLLLFLAAWRWPFLLCASEYNPDESQYIAGAMALKHDPVFWRSVDGHTAGPLNFYAVLPLHALGVPLDYFNIRLTGLLLTWLTLVLAQRLFRTFAPPLAAHLAVLPAALFFATATDSDFVHYASELLPMMLMALAVYWQAGRPLASAFTAGCLPWAKLQAIPLAVVLIVWPLWRTWRESRRRGVSPVRPVGRVLVGALAPTLLALAALAIFGQLEHFFRRYLLQNLAYVGEGQPLPAVLRELMRRAQDDGQFVFWAASATLFLLAAGLGYSLRRQRPSAPFWLGVALLVTAVICIIVPARATLHYALLLFLPAMLCLGATLGDFWPHPGLRRGFIGLILVCTLVPLGLRLRQPVPAMFGRMAEHWQRPHTSLGSVLRHWHLPGARLALWGWSSSVYVESGLPQATRDTVSMWCIEATPQRDYYRATYVAEIMQHRPALFVDAVGRNATAYSQRGPLGHENFPALAAYVRQHYLLVTDLEGPRVYVRTDHLERRPMTTEDLNRLVHRGRVDYNSPAAPVTLQTPQDRIDGRLVQMMEPPAALRHSLEGDERILHLAFGFHPRAYTEGKTDGAELLAELHPPGRPPLEIYRRLLDPQHRPEDRGRQIAEVVLPPFPPGTSLTVRTTAGKAGDTAWDWVYFDQLRFARSPFFLPKQFPGFRRIPDQVAAAYPHVIRHEADWRLMVPPPAALTFVLDGTERQLNFSYGLAEGSYTRGGATDGALYQVELQRDGAAARVLFEQHLDPVANPGHRGVQSADLILPAGLQPGDRIVLRIDGGRNDSWDWTYLASLKLH